MLPQISVDKGLIGECNNYCNAFEVDNFPSGKQISVPEEPWKCLLHLNLYLTSQGVGLNPSTLENPFLMVVTLRGCTYIT